MTLMSREWMRLRVCICHMWPLMRGVHGCHMWWLRVTIITGRLSGRLSHVVADNNWKAMARVDEGVHAVTSYMWWLKSLIRWTLFQALFLY